MCLRVYVSDVSDGDHWQVWNWFFPRERHPQRFHILFLDCSPWLCWWCLCWWCFNIGILWWCTPGLLRQLFETVSVLHLPSWHTPVGNMFCTTAIAHWVGTNLVIKNPLCPQQCLQICFCATTDIIGVLCNLCSMYPYSSSAVMLDPPSQSVFLSGTRDEKPNCGDNPYILGSTNQATLLHCLANSKTCWASAGLYALPERIGLCSYTCLQALWICNSFRTESFWTMSHQTHPTPT